MIKAIGLIGDSIGHGFYDEQDLGWFSKLGRLILKDNQGGYIFNNMSQSGDNIADATNRAVFEVFSRKFDLILVNVGINDLRRRKNSEMQLDFSEGVRIMYWNKLLDMLEKTGAKLVVTDLLPVVETKCTEDDSVIRYNSDVERYNEIIKEICQERKINYFERNNLWKNKDLENLYQDATHPNEQGHQIMAEEIYNYLKNNKFI